MCQLKWNSVLCTESNMEVRKEVVNKFVNQVNVDRGWATWTYLLWVENSCQYLQDTGDSVINFILVDSNVRLTSVFLIFMWTEFYFATYWIYAVYLTFPSFRLFCLNISSTKGCIYFNFPWKIYFLSHILSANGRYILLLSFQPSSLTTKATTVTNAIKAANLKADTYFGSNARSSTATSFECSTTNYMDGGCPNIYQHPGYTLDVTKCGRSECYILANIWQ